MATRPRRRCASCRAPLPAGAHPRRRYCGPACVARAYRARRRAARAERFAGIIATVYAELTRVELFGALATARTRDAQRARARVACPVCGTVVWKRVRVRRDAVYCSPACRTRAYRTRRARVDHDANPSPARRP